jgi:hypothetical protein
VGGEEEGFFYDISKNTVKEENDEDDDEDIIHTHNRNINELFRKKPEKTAPFNIKVVNYCT